MGYIELGVPEIDERDEALPARVAWRRRSRWVLPCLVALVALLACGAAAPPAPSLVSPVLTGLDLRTAGRSTLIVGDTLYVAHRRVDAVFIDRYDIPAGGRPVWRVPAADPGTRVDLTYAAGVLLAISLAPGAGDSISPLLRTVGYDPATGARLWEHPGRPLPTRTAAELLLYSDDVTGNDVGYAAVDARTGRELWYREFPGRVDVEAATDFQGYPVAPARLVSLSRPGVLRLIDPASGRVLASRAIPMYPGADPTAQALTYLGAVFLDVNGVAYAYRGDTLAPLWTTRHGLGQHWIVPCAGVLCTAGYDGVVALDPGTGRPLWRTTTLGGVMLSRWVAVQAGPDAVRLVEPRTGRPVLTMRGWQPLAAGNGSPADRYELLTGPAGGGDGWLAALDVAAPRLVPLATSPSFEPGCSATDRYVTCVDGERLRVWRYAVPS